MAAAGLPGSEVTSLVGLGTLIGSVRLLLESNPLSNLRILTLSYNPSACLYGGPPQTICPN